MSDPAWEAGGEVSEFSFFPDGHFESVNVNPDWDYSPNIGHHVRLNPSEAVNLASALLQFSTRNAAWWRVNGEAE